MLGWDQESNLHANPILRGKVMLSRNRFFLFAASLFSLSFLALLASCGGSSGSLTRGTAPPSGSFSASNLNGTYVFSVSGTDANGAPVAIAGTVTANGQSGITGGTLDINDAEFTPVTFVANTAVSGNSTYQIGADGRGRMTINATTPFGQALGFDFVLQDSSHGLITEFDNLATGSGTIDLQSSGVTPSGTYAFLFTGGTTSGSSVATAGNFTLAGNAVTGITDFNTGALANPDLALSGQFALGPSSTPSTTFTTSAGTQTYDVFAVDATHLKFIEMDSNGTLSGDAYAQTSATIPGANYAFVLEGAFGSNTISAAGGFMTLDGSGNITNTSTIDVNNSGNGAPATVSFSGTYTAAGTGRYTLGGFSNFPVGSSYAAYPYSGGVFLLEIDDAGFMVGSAYPQTQTSFPSSEGYAFNLSGIEISNSFSGTSVVEVDDIAEFTGTGGNLTGVIDENFNPGGTPIYAVSLAGTYSAPDANGRGQISASAGNSSNSTLNGGFNLNYYTVDGTTFPFIQTDGNGQTAAGVFMVQNASASSKAARSHLFVLPRLMKSEVLTRKNTKK